MFEFFSTCFFFFFFFFRDLAASDELKEALLSSKKSEPSPKADLSIIKPALAQEETVLYGDRGLTSEERFQLCTIADTLNVRLVPLFG